MYIQFLHFLKLDFVQVIYNIGVSLSLRRVVLGSHDLAVKTEMFEVLEKVVLVLLDCEVELSATILNSLAVWVLLLLPSALRTAVEESLLNVDAALLIE